MTNLGRGCAFGDFDNDGDVDIVINNLDGPPTLLRNDGGRPATNSIAIKCVGTRSNRSAIGARVKVTSGDRSQIDEVMSGSSYYSQNDLAAALRPGRATRVRARSRSAGRRARRRRFSDLPANHLFVIQEAKGIVSSRSRSGSASVRTRVHIAGRRSAALRLLLLASGAGTARRATSQFTDVDAGPRRQLHARKLADVEQVPDRDDGRRRRAARLRQRRPSRHLLHQRRKARRSDAADDARPDKSDRRYLEPPVSSERRRHVRRRHREGGADGHAAEPLRHGRRGRRLRQRRLRTISM